MAEKALADIASEQIVTATGDLLFVEKAGVPAKITWGNLAALANLGLTTQAEALLDNTSYSDMRDTLQLGSTATRDIDNTEDLTVATTDVLSRGGVSTALSNVVIGLGQTWTNVTRAHSTIYENTTGRPIMVSVAASSGTLRDFQVSSDGFSTNTITVGSIDGSTSVDNVSAIVPAGHSYRMNGSCTINDWVELR